MLFLRALSLRAGYAGNGLVTPFGSSYLTSQGKPLPGTLRRKGRGADQETRRDLETDMRRNIYTWGELQRLAQDCDDWRVLIGSLCPRRGCRQ